MTWSWGSLYGVINYDRDARKSGPLADARNMPGPDILHGPNFSLRQPSSNTSDVTAYTVGFQEIVSSQFFAGTQRAVSVADMVKLYHAILSCAGQHTKYPNRSNRDRTISCPGRTRPVFMRVLPLKRGHFHLLVSRNAPMLCKQSGF